MLSALGCGAGVARADDAPRHVLEAGPVRVVVEPWKAGISIFLDGVMISRGSGMVITTPPWAPHYYLGPSAAAVRDAALEWIHGGIRLSMKHRGENDSFEGDETISVYADGRVQQVFEGRFLRDSGEALLQWQMAALNPTLLIGRTYRAFRTDGEKREGAVPVAPVSAEVGPATLSDRLSSIELDSRLGLIRIEVESDRNVLLYDYRKSRWADVGRPLFWLGDLGTRFKSGDRLWYRVTFRLPASAAPAAVRLETQRNIDATPSALAQTWPALRMIVPKPKRAMPGSGACIVRPASADNDPPSGGVRIADHPPSASAAAAALRDLLRTAFSVEAAAPDAAGPKPAIEVRFLPAAAGGLRAAEAYRLRVAPQAIVIEAADERGFLNAVQTLRQLAFFSSTGNAGFRCFEIDDWPSLQFRGVHLFTGGKGPELHKRLIRNVLAPLKMNHLMLEAEYVEWDGHPEIHHPEYGMPKAEVREILDLCRQQGITVTPLINSLGHCQWMFTGDRNLELAEDPEAKWAYCVTNPKTYDFIFSIYAEALELFQPRWLHIGHDEYADRGRVPFRESSKPYTLEQLFMMDTLKLHAWLKERGVRTAMWGDMLLAKGEAPDACNAASPESAAKLREELPDDVLITDWHYAGDPPEKFTNLDLFHAEGHETVAAVWNRPANIVNFAKAAHEQKSLGLLQTTWAGYSLDPASFERELPQYMAYVLAAEAAWNADNPPDPAAYPAGEMFLRLMDMSTLRPANRSGWLLDLTPACNLSTRAADGGGWFGLGPQHDLSALPPGDLLLEGINFARRAEPLDALVLRGRLFDDDDAPDEATLRLRAPLAARSVAILHTTNFAAGHGEKVATAEFQFDTTSAQRAEFVYGRSAFAPTDTTPAAEAPIVWSGVNAAGEPIALRVLMYECPADAGALRAITLRSTGGASSLVVLGVTVLAAP